MSSTFKWCCLFLTSLQNAVQDFPLNFELSTLGSERVNKKLSECVGYFRLVQNICYSSGTVRGFKITQYNILQLIVMLKLKQFKRTYFSQWKEIPLFYRTFQGSRTFCGVGYFHFKCCCYIAILKRLYAFSKLFLNKVHVLQGKCSIV